MKRRPLACDRYHIELFRSSDDSRWRASAVDFIGCSAEADTPEAALAALTVQIADVEADDASDHSNRVGEADPVILRFDGDALDEIVATRPIHLERTSDSGWYLGVGSLQVWLHSQEGHEVEADFEVNGEAIRRETA